MEDPLKYIAKEIEAAKVAYGLGIEVVRGGRGNHVVEGWEGVDI